MAAVRLDYSGSLLSAFRALVITLSARELLEQKGSNKKTIKVTRADRPYLI